MCLIDRYIVRSIATPLLGSLALAFMVLGIEELARLLNVVSRTGAEPGLIWRMLGFLLPEYLALAIPVSVLLGVFVGFRKLAQSAELDALGAIGLGLGRLLRIPCILAFVLAAVTLGIIGFVEPITGYQFDRLGFELDTGAIGASVKVGEFARLGNGSVLRVDASNGHGRQLLGIFLVREVGEDTIAVTAQTGRFLLANQTNLLRLRKGRLVQRSKAFKGPRTFSFDTYDFPIGLPAGGDFRARGVNSSELTLAELVARTRDFAFTPAERRRVCADINARLAKAALILLLPLLASSLAVSVKRSSAGAVIGILVLVAFDKISQQAIEIGASGALEPIFAVWAPFLIFAVVILRVFWLVSHRPGGWASLELRLLPASVSRIAQWVGLLPKSKASAAQA